MATSGTNYTAKWTLQDGVLTISPVSGNSGIMRIGNNSTADLSGYIPLTNSEWESVTEIRFVNSVRFQYNSSLIEENYVAKTYFSSFFARALNVIQIDVTGLNITGATKVKELFSLDNLTTIIGISVLDVSSCSDFSYMFENAKITSLDISSFSASALNNADSIIGMFNGMVYCNSIALPTNFQRTNSGTIYNEAWYDFGIANTRVSATKGGVTISSDKDFFKLTETSQGGTWTRDISSAVELKFNVQEITRDGNVAEMKYNYYADSAIVEVYLKTTDQSSFPSTYSETFNIDGVGAGTSTFNLTLDSAYDVMVKVYDGQTTLYTYPSIDSNVLLFSVDEDGNMSASGDIEDGSGNVLANKLDSSGIFDLIYPVGSYYWTSNGSFSPANTFGGTWEKIDAGVTLVSAGTGYTVQSGTAKDGGEETVKLTDQQMAHGHGFTNPTVNKHHHDSLASAGFVNGTGLTMTSKRAYTAANTSGVGYVVSGSATAISTSATTADATATTSGGAVANLSGASSTRTAFDNMPPYKAAYCWHRTA